MLSRRCASAPVPHHDHGREEGRQEEEEEEKETKEHNQNRPRKPRYRDLGEEATVLHSLGHMISIQQVGASHEWPEEGTEPRRVHWKSPSFRCNETPETIRQDSQWWRRSLPKKRAMKKSLCGGFLTPKETFSNRPPNREQRERFSR